MTLNCRPGDLARIISTPETRKYGIVDRIFKLTVLVGKCNDGHRAAWGYEGPRIEIPLPGSAFIVTGISDDILRPIRDPGDDAVDETLVRLGKPVPDEVHA